MYGFADELGVGTEGEVEGQLAGLREERVSSEHPSPPMAPAPQHNVLLLLSLSLLYLPQVASRQTLATTRQSYLYFCMLLMESFAWPE